MFIQFSIKTHSIIGFLIKFIDRNFIISFVSLWGFLGWKISLNYDGKFKNKIEVKNPRLSSLPVLISITKKKKFHSHNFLHIHWKNLEWKLLINFWIPQRNLKFDIHVKSSGPLKDLNECAKKILKFMNILIFWGFEPGEHWKCIFIR
jgi:hypothetical protein